MSGPGISPVNPTSSAIAQSNDISSTRLAAPSRPFSSCTVDASQNSNGSSSLCRQLLTDGGGDRQRGSVIHRLAGDVASDAARLRIPDHPGAGTDTKSLHVGTRSSADVDKPVIPFELFLLAVPPADHVAARGREDARHGASRREHQRWLIERREPARRSAQLVAVVRPEVQEPLIGNTLHHETDLVGVGNQEETGPRATDASQDVVHPSAPNVLRELAPAPLDPILDRVLVSGWPGQLGKLFHQLEHELDLPGTRFVRRHTPSIRRPSLNSNRGRPTGTATSTAHWRRFSSTIIASVLAGSGAQPAGMPGPADFKYQSKCG